VEDAEIDLELEFELVGGRPVDAAAAGDRRLEHLGVVERRPDFLAWSREQVVSAEFHRAIPLECGQS
jgi:hypothetical protein